LLGRFARELIGSTIAAEHGLLLVFLIEWRLGLYVVVVLAASMLTLLEGYVGCCGQGPLCPAALGREAVELSAAAIVETATTIG
jgi:hypothetical protein